MKDRIKILIADDDPVLLKLLPAQMSAQEFEISITETGTSVIEALKKEAYDVILLDVNLPDISGVEVLSKIRETNKSTEVVMLTADTSLETGIQAMRLGAYDYITKPAKSDEVEIIIRKAAEKRQLVKQNKQLQVAVRQQNENFVVKPVYASPVMEEIYAQAERVADLDTTLLITGESGTGKDVFARWIHSLSSRSELPLISVNCGALPENLFESEFFGYEKGAFTGAAKQKIGLIEAAESSTLFLDEIGEMPMTMQVKLLHFLENGTYRRVGSTQDRKINVRVIAATNKVLTDEIKNSSFRSDLFYRLNVITFNLPPLRERVEDIPKLIDFFLENLKLRYNRHEIKLSDSAASQLKDHQWHGNIRELKNTLERNVALSSGDTIKKIHGLTNHSFENELNKEQTAFKPLTIAELEKTHILNVLKNVDGKREKAASILGITSRTLYRKLKEYKV